jgi:hypothetical protein
MLLLQPAEQRTPLLPRHRRDAVKRRGDLDLLLLRVQPAQQPYERGRVAALQRPVDQSYQPFGVGVERLLDDLQAVFLRRGRRVLAP